uniref:Uncharacterized protein n=1 Tax=Leptobrachium leishanense TaxID=445787 RepID=A0A8C5LNX6_9ANUR
PPLPSSRPRSMACAVCLASRVHQHWLRVARDTFEPWDILLLCEHPAVYTVGIWRGLYLVQEERQLGLRANVHCMDRSGVITFHGPRWYTDGQLVCYPVLHLCRSHLGLQAGRDRVWIWDRKICAIGESLGPRNGTQSSSSLCILGGVVGGGISLLAPGSTISWAGPDLNRYRKPALGWLSSQCPRGRRNWQTASTALCQAPTGGLVPSSGPLKGCFPAAWEPSATFLRDPRVHEIL